MTAKRFAAALKLFERVIESDATCWAALMGAGKLYLRQGQAKRAATALIWANKLCPRKFESNFWLSQALIKNGDDAGAEKYLKLAEKIGPKNSGLVRLTREIEMARQKRERRLAVEARKRGIEQKKCLAVEVVKESKTKLSEETYQYCDGFCARCKLREGCAAYRRRTEFETRCLAMGKDPRAAETVMEEIEKKFKDWRGFIERDLEKLGIAVKVISERDFKQEKALDESVRQSDLFKMAQKFAEQSVLFLELVGNYWEKHRDGKKAGWLDDVLLLDHYPQMCMSKLHQALKQLASGGQAEDGQKNLALVLAALEASRGAVRRLRSAGRRRWLIEGALLAEQVGELIDCLREKYPDLKQYQAQIIFNAG